MIFKGLMVDIRMESATFGCATVDSGNGVVYCAFLQPPGLYYCNGESFQ